MYEYQHMSIDEEKLIHRQPRLRLRRSLVIALYFSFFACLAALWLSGTLLGGADQLLSSWLFRAVVDHRLMVLGMPFACLLACYGALRRLTGDIMAVQERYLDERQKVMRDQAHRSAFKIIKLSCLVIPALLLAQYLPWFHHSSTNVVNTALVSYPFNPFMIAPPPTIVNEARVYPPPRAVNFFPQRPVNFPQLYTLRRALIIHSVPAQTTMAASSTEVAFAGAMLVLCLLLLFSALPMSVLAWKGQA